jgi:hypothetical protein
MEFKVSKIDVNLYAIEIPDTTLSTETLSLPQFPPHDFLGFTYIEGAKTTGGVVVRIGVERGARISAFAQGSDIVVRMAK